MFRGDGAPVLASDYAALGLAVPAEPTSEAITGHDGQTAAAVFDHHERGYHTVLVGEVEQAGLLAQRLGLAANSPVAAVAAAAVAKFGSATPLHLIGEWSLLQRAADGTVTAMLSAARRDPLLYVQRGARLAFAPDLLRLATLEWCDSEIDEFGLLSRMGRAPIRGRRGNRTMLRGVREVQCGETVIFAPDGKVNAQRCDTMPRQEPVSGSYAELIEQTQDLLATIMAERAARAPRSAFLLSGGLDSSLLATFGAAADGAKPIGICSVAPPGSGLQDEVAFARIVADRLGFPLHTAAPHDALSPYRPSEQAMLGANGPPLSNRQPLTEAFHQIARAAGATLLVNGTYGEMSVTSRLPQQLLRARLRAQAAALWHRLRPPGQSDIDDYPFHVRIAPHRLGTLPEPIEAILREPLAEPRWPTQDGTFGSFPGIEKALAQPNEFYPGALRMDFPFRDLRLLRLFASFPVKTLLHEGHDRPVVRNLLAGRLPDSIRLRTSGMPASPDHLVRLQAKAEAAQQRIAEFRRAELDDWFDLDWLDSRLARIAQHGLRDLGEANQVQITALAVEFLLWWRTRR